MFSSLLTLQGGVSGELHPLARARASTTLSWVNRPQRGMPPPSRFQPVTRSIRAN